MSNRSASKQHGMNSVNEHRPKASAAKKRNKAKARARREAHMRSKA